MSYKIICPYCHGEFELHGEYHEELIMSETEFTVECRDCGKVIMVKPYVTIKLKARKCKCQGKNHKWAPSVTFPKCFTEMVCEHCGEHREMTDKEKSEYNIPSVHEYMDFLKRNNENVQG